MTPWALLNFFCIFMVLHLFKMENDLQNKTGLWRWIKIYTFYIFSSITIVFLLFYVMENPWVMLGVNSTEIIIIAILQKKVNTYKLFLGEFAPKDNSKNVSGKAAAKFFTQEVLDTLRSKAQTYCEKKDREAIVSKYASKFKGKPEKMPFEIAKAILKEVNQQNDQT